MFLSLPDHPAILDSADTVLQRPVNVRPDPFNLRSPDDHQKPIENVGNIPRGGELMRTFDESDDNSLVTRFAAQLETALLAQELVDTNGLPDERAKALLAAWLIGTFNGCVAGLGSLDRGILDWQPEGSGHRLVWFISSGVVCPLAIWVVHRAKKRA